MAGEAPFRELVRYAVGGGWGAEEPTSDTLPVRVIRGTDFANIAAGAFDKVPRRFEARAKAERRLLQANDIVLEISGGSRTSNQSTGRTILITQAILDRLGEPVIPASFCRLIRVREDVVAPRYAYFALQEMYTSGRAGLYEHHSTGISNFQFEYFLDQELVWLPPLPEQRAIAHILGTLDDKIELNRRQNETLEAMARALFKAWFVDFEPVRAKMEGRWQRGQSLPGLPAHLYDLFPDRLVESELGEIPEGWRHSTIGEEVTVCGGSTPSTKEPEFWEGGQHCWATPKDLSALKFPVLLDTDRKITDAGLAKISSGLLPVGTVLLSSRAPIGYLAIAEVPTAINQGFIAMKCDGALPNVFVLPWCRESMDVIVGNANGSTFQEISKSNFRPLRVVVPSDPVLTSFTRLAVSLYRQLAENERESRSLAQLRDTLLPKLISGELRVPDAEAFLRERGL